MGFLGTKERNDDVLSVPIGENPIDADIIHDPGNLIVAEVAHLSDMVDSPDHIAPVVEGELDGVSIELDEAGFRMVFDAGAVPHSGSPDGPGRRVEIDGELRGHGYLFYIQPIVSYVEIDVKWKARATFPVFFASV